MTVQNIGGGDGGGIDIMANVAVDAVVAVEKQPLLSQLQRMVVKVRGTCYAGLPTANPYGSP